MGRPPKSNSSQELIDSLGEFSQNISASLRSDVKVMLDSQSTVLAERIEHLREFTDTKFRHLEERQVAENRNLRDQIDRSGKAVDELSTEVKFIKSDLSQVKHDLSISKDSSAITQLSEEITKARNELSQQITKARGELNEKIDDTNKHLAITTQTVTGLTTESLVREGGRKVLLAIWATIGTFVVSGMGTMIYLAIKHWG